MNHRQRMRQVVTGLLSQFPFYGALALRVAVHPDPGVKNMACDGVNLSYNPKWVDETTADELRFTTARLVTACALKHHTRRGERDPGKWNMASYLASAPLVEDAGVPRTGDFQVPAELAWNGDVRKMPVERIYELIPDNDDGESQGGGDQQQDGLSGGGLGANPPPGEIRDYPGEGDDGDGDQQSQSAPSRGGTDDDGEGQDAGAGQPSEDDVQRHEQTWDQAAHQAAQMSKSAGNDAGSLQAKLQAAHSPAQDWTEMLKEYATALSQTDYTWSRPNRRHIDSGLYLPSLHADQAMPPIVVIADLSGSTTPYWSDFWQCVRDMVEAVRPEALHFLGVDTRVAVAASFDPDDVPETFDVECGGGTDFKPGFEWVDRELPENPACLIYLTDGICHSFPQAPDYPVLWCQTAPGGRVPFGDVIELEGVAA